MKENWSENEKKKRYLMSYRWAKKQEERILDEIQTLRMDKMFPSTVNDGMPKGSEQRDLSDYAAKLDELIQELKDERLEKVKRLSDIQKSIRDVENDDEQTVLRLRYIDGMPWEDICVKIGYSWRQTHRIHSNALKNIKVGEEQ